MNPAHHPSGAPSNGAVGAAPSTAATADAGPSAAAAAGRTAAACVGEALRASDVERAEIVARIHHAVGEGRLDLAEAETRIAAAYAARYRAELPPLVGDLPSSADVPAAPPTWSAIWSFIVWRLRIMLFGAGDSTPPSAEQCRLAALLVPLVLVWILACALLGAALVSH